MRETIDYSPVGVMRVMRVTLKFVPDKILTDRGNAGTAGNFGTLSTKRHNYCTSALRNCTQYEPSTERAIRNSAHLSDNAPPEGCPDDALRATLGLGPATLCLSKTVI